MKNAIPGIHHVTAITADAQANVDFYCAVLGLRLVKLTVNFDDPRSYHLYYGDELGRPGTIMTFFAWPGALRGRVGPPQVSATAFSVPAGSLGYWRDRLADYQLESADRFGQRALRFADPDGMPLELVAAENASGLPHLTEVVPAEHAIRSFAGVTLAAQQGAATAELLTQIMGFRAAGSDGRRSRYVAGAGDGPGSVVDLLESPDAAEGELGAGVVHHVAFRTADEAQQRQWRQRIEGSGLGVSPVIDRSYFHSIYYREPAGVLFEIATDGPGFTIDEPAEMLGTSLKLPPQYEAYRAAIEQVLPPLRLPLAGALRR